MKCILFFISLFEMECADMCDLMLNKNHEIFLTLTKKKYISQDFPDLNKVKN